MRHLYACLSVLLLSTVSAAAEREMPEGVPGPAEVGRAQPLEVVPDLSAAAEASGERIWTRNVRIEGATFLKPHFVDVNLRAGDVLVVRSRTGHVVEEIRGRGPKGLGTFWGLSAYGDQLRLELRFRHRYPRAPFRIDQVIVGDIDLMPPQADKSICAPPDFEDVICYQDDPAKWANVLASAGVMSVGGNPATGLYCSGANVSAGNYLLTNEHCIGSQASCNGAEFVFKYYRTGCSDSSPPTGDWVSYRCDEIVAQSPFNGICEANLANLDFTLATVIGDPASTFGFVAPDPKPITSGEAIYIVQHPDGRPHEITHGSGPDVEVDGTVLRYFDTLDTEGGSSGSPIFRESDHKLVGLHHCGGCSSPSVGNRGMLMSDIFPLISEFVCKGGIELIEDGFEDLEQVFGNSNGLIDRGEIWQFYPKVRNQACTLDAFNVRATVAPNAGNVGTIELLDTEVDFGTIPAGSSARSAAPIRFLVGEDVICGSSFAFDLNDLEADGTLPIDVEEIFTAQVGEEVFTIIFEEHFDGLDPFEDWTVADGGTGTGPAQTWTDTNPGERSPSLAEPFAIVDSNFHGPGNTMDEELISEVLDLSLETEVRLQFQHDFRWFPGGQDEKADVDVRSTATGGDWVTVASFSSDTSGMVDLDVTAQAAGQSDFQIRFRYYQAGWELWWAVDDIALLSGELICNDFADFVFLDRFESGDTTEWSRTQQ